MGKGVSSLVSTRILYFILLLALSVAPVAAQFSPFRPLPAQPPIPDDNVQSPAKIALGKTLYFDPRLSGSGRTTCQQCHNLAYGAADGMAYSTGDDGTLTKRSAPTLWNVGFYTIWFWDGRAATLEDAVERHLMETNAMNGGSAEELSRRISAISGYGEQFRAAFGSDAVNSQRIAQALSSFLRTLVTQDSAFDRFLRGDKTALTETQQRGFEVFVDSGCASCHFWVSLAGPVPGLAFQIGEGFYELFPNYPDAPSDRKYKFSADLGRFHVTGDEADKRLFRVPTLRNVAHTAPYFHNGAVTTLKEAVRVMAEAQLRVDFSDAQLDDVVAFLNSLSGQYPPISVPQLPQ